MPSPQSQQIRATLTKPESLNTAPLSQQRQEWEEAALWEPLPEGTEIEAHTIGDVHCEKVTVGSADNYGLILFVHGGGFNMGSCLTHRRLAALLSEATSMPVLSIDYRLAPENPYPAGLDDVITVYKYLIEQDYTSSQIVFCGDSAGANLVVSALLALRDEGVALPASAVLLSPWLDLTLSGKSLRSRASNDPLITEFELRDSAQHYTSEDNLGNPSVSPIFADLQSLPPVLIHVGDHEILLSDSTYFATRAQSQGVNVQLHVFEDMWHVWHSFAPELPEALDALEEISRFIASTLQ